MGSQINVAPFYFKMQTLNNVRWSKMVKFLIANIVNLNYLYSTIK